MSIEPATVEAEGYCTVDDVLSFFDRFDGEVTDDSIVTEEQLENRIAAKSSQIDSYTGHAWRERRMVNEFHNLRGPYRWNSGLELSLTRRDIRIPMDPEKGDKLEFWRGSEYVDFLDDDNDFTEGRNEDFWIEESTGTIYVRRRRTFFNRHREMRITYRFGKDKVPAIIQEGCAQLVAADLMETDFYRYTTPGNDEAPDASTVADKMREQVKNNLETFKEVRGQGLDF